MNNIEKKFLSFIVPVYNVEKFLPACLDSLLSQDLDENEYEIICINDGSTDSSFDILSKYRKVHQNIIVINKENGGVSSARNMGIEIATGEYIWFVDSDDCICSDVLKSMKQLLVEKPDILKFRMKKIEEDYVYDASTKENILKSNEKIEVIGPSVWNFLVRRDILMENGIRFREGMAYCEDALFTYYISMHIRKELCIGVENQIYLYRMRKNSVSRVSDTSKINNQVNSFFEIAKIYSNECEENISLDKFQKRDTKRRQYLATMNGLTFLPASSFIIKDIIMDLKVKKLYPFPMLWWHISDAIRVRGMKLGVVEFARNLLRFKSFLYLYCKIAKKIDIVNKHKNSI